MLSNGMMDTTARGMGQGSGQGLRGGMMQQQLFDIFNGVVAETTLVAFVISIIAAAAVSAFVSYRVTRPVQRMILAAEHISSGSYSQRVPVSEFLQEKDLDEVGRLALRFNQMAESLENIEGMRRQLIGDVSHELRTPLTTIKGSMEGLVDGILPATPEVFEQIEHEADRLQRLVEDLQELSRVEGGKPTLNLKIIPISNLFVALKSILLRQYEAKGVSLEFVLSDNLPPVRVDEDRIGQVLINLAGNALQYTPQGGKVSIGAVRQGHMVEFYVQDTGAGIPAEHHENIFSRFYRIDKSRSRSQGGSGIGLTIARALVEAHDGNIWAESKGEGQGSTFRFTLPSA